jgi:hypothetical protein
MDKQHTMESYFSNTIGANMDYKKVFQTVTIDSGPWIKYDDLNEVKHDIEGTVIRGRKLDNVFIDDAPEPKTQSKKSKEPPANIIINVGDVFWREGCIFYVNMPFLGENLWQLRCYSDENIPSTNLTDLLSSSYIAELIMSDRYRGEAYDDSIIRRNVNNGWWIYCGNVNDVNKETHKRLKIKDLL